MVPMVIINMEYIFLSSAYVLCQLVFDNCHSLLAIIHFSPQELLVHFRGNKAAISGDAVYSGDFDECRFLGIDTNSSRPPFPSNIFVPPDSVNSSFVY